MLFPQQCSKSCILQIIDPYQVILSIIFILRMKNSSPPSSSRVRLATYFVWNVTSVNDWAEHSIRLIQDLILGISGRWCHTKGSETNFIYDQKGLNDNCDFPLNLWFLNNISIYALICENLKFYLYLLEVSQKYFFGIFVLSGHKRTRKHNKLIMCYKMNLPNRYILVYTYNINCNVYWLANKTIRRHCA